MKDKGTDEEVTDEEITDEEITDEEITDDKFVNCIFYHFIITVCYIVHNTNLLLSTRIKYIPHVCHG
jgi:hypothetical protein